MQLPDGHGAPAFFGDDLIAQVEAFEADRNLAEPTNLELRSCFLAAEAAGVLRTKTSPCQFNTFVADAHVRAGDRVPIESLNNVID
jgi:hypothetical protein